LCASHFLTSGAVWESAVTDGVNTNWQFRLTKFDGRRLAVCLHGRSVAFLEATVNKVFEDGRRWTALP
jgi:hypothetical protein